MQKTDVVELQMEREVTGSPEEKSVEPSPYIRELAACVEQLLRAAVRVGASAEAGKPVLTVDEAAELLAVNRKTVYALIDSRELPGVRRFGKTFRISRDALMTWMYRGRGA